MFKVIRRRLSLKIAIALTVIAIPIMAAGVGLVVINEHTSVKDLVLQKGRIAARVGAQQIGLALERGLAEGAFTMDDLLQPKYEEIKFPFRVEARRYHTKFDSWTDVDGWQSFQDSFLLDPDFKYASAMDMNGYVPTPHSEFAEIPNGNKEHDSISRWKQRYNQPLQLAAVRYEGSEPTFVQDYTRKAGTKVEKIWDVAAPIYVKGQHWGAFRVGVLQDQIASRGRELAISLAWILGFTLLGLVVVIFWLLQRSMRPLVELSGLAFRLSTDDINIGSGKREMDTPIRAKSNDEIGEMAKALNRLRVSLGHAMMMADRPSAIPNGSTVGRAATAVPREIGAETTRPMAYEQARKRDD